MPVPHIKIDPKGDEDLRRPIYADVEELINNGFLAVDAAIDDIPVTIRSLGPQEHYLLRHRVGIRGGIRVWKEWTIASSIWIVDGQVVSDPNSPHMIRETLRQLHPMTVETLFSLYVGLNNRVSKAMSRTEAFCYETFSRSLWRMLGRDSQNGRGLNHIQRMWIAFNLGEDDRTRWLQEWTAAKLIASAHAPKGIKQMNRREESERKLEDERRERVIRETWAKTTGKAIEEENGVSVYRARTPEELVDEMNRALRGEKDWHDMVVDGYKNAIRKKYEGDKERHDKRMHALAEISATTNTNTLVGYTLEQLQAMHGSVPKRGGVVLDSGGSGHVYRRFIEPETRVGGIGRGGKGETVNEQTSLDDALSGRRPGIGGE